MERLNQQQVFDIVARHLLTQGHVSAEEILSPDGDRIGYNCVYRAKNGDKCAIGVLIPDDKYSITMEGNRVKELLIYHGEINAQFEQTDDMVRLLERLQSIHDGAYELQISQQKLAFELGLLRAARMFDLKQDIIYELQK